MRRTATVCITLVLVFGLPLLGVYLSGGRISRYLEFPPRTSYVEHEPFSWLVFIFTGCLIVGFVGPFIVRIITVNLERQSRETLTRGEKRYRAFPWWGWAAIGWTGLWWVLAWTRFPLMGWVQEHTFTPLWLGYIVTVNAWTYARTGSCMMRNRLRYFVSLFPLSAAFWWVFEYLNRFVQNWYYAGVTEVSTVEYVLRATIPFSTVLPAVLCTTELLTTFPGVSAGLEQFKPMGVTDGKLMTWAVFILSCAGLLGLSLWPNYLYPFVWVAPLLLSVSLQAIDRQPTIFSSVMQGDWTQLWVAAVAALICGFFWELWNWNSVARWQYAIPFVHRFQVFEMPILGYAGYLPFGLGCLVVADLCLSRPFFKQP